MRTMSKTTAILAMAATLGLMACASVQQETMYPLVDATGRTVAMVRQSVVGNTPPGTRDLSPPGAPVVNSTTSEGRPVITYVQPGEEAATPAPGG